MGPRNISETGPGHYEPPRPPNVDRAQTVTPVLPALPRPRATISCMRFFTARAARLQDMPANHRPREHWTWTASTETAALALSGFWLLAANRPFLGAALQGREWGDASAWGFAAALAVLPSRRRH